MIKLITHPVFDNLFSSDCIKIQDSESSIDIAIISDFLPQKKFNIHNGLLEAVKYRILHPNDCIIFLSFQSKAELLKYDDFGILTLPGTVYIRLPFEPGEFLKIFKEQAKYPLVIPIDLWISFSTYACKRLLKEKISQLKHEEDKPGLVNLVTGPLRSAAVIAPSFPESIPLIKQQLLSFRTYIENDEIAELFLLSNASASLSDYFLSSVSQFVNSLQQLNLYVENDEININQLIFTIDLINETLSKIQSQ